MEIIDVVLEFIISCQELVPLFHCHMNCNLRNDALVPHVGNAFVIQAFHSEGSGRISCYRQTATSVATLSVPATVSFSAFGATLRLVDNIVLTVFLRNRVAAAECQNKCCKN